jgi:hypothetical protein
MEVPTASKIATIRSRNSTHSHWGWKLPNTIYYFDEIRSALRNPVFLVTYRNPFSVFMSASTRDGDGLHEGHFNAPIYHYEKMHQLIHRHPNIPVFVSSYEQAVENSAGFIDELCGLLPILPSREQQARARAFIAPGAYRPLPTIGDLP